MTMFVHNLEGDHSECTICGATYAAIPPVPATPPEGLDDLYDRVAAMLCQHVGDAPTGHHTTSEAIDAYHGVTARTIVRVALRATRS